MDERGRYSIAPRFEDSGRVIVPQNLSRITFVSDRTRGNDSAQMIVHQTDHDIEAIGAEAGDTVMSLSAPAKGQTHWVRTRGGAAGSVAGTWVNRMVLLDGFIPFTCTLVIDNNGQYTATFERNEQGTMELLPNNRYRYTNPLNVPFEGSYHFDGNNRVTYISPIGTTTWERVGG